MLERGTQAPDALVFEAPRRQIRLADRYGGRPVVLLFFPLAFSSTCTDELCRMADDYSAYRELGAEVLGISVDSPYTNVKFAESCNAHFPILSDWHREASSAFGVLLPEVSGLRDVSDRAAFVIDRGGTIVYAWRGADLDELPDFAAIRAAVEAAAARGAA
jgi:glutaredoxin-dependent peroxiredoxin